MENTSVPAPPPHRSGTQLINSAWISLAGWIIRDRIKVLLMEVEIGVSPFTAAMAQFVAIADRSTGHPVQMENYMLEHQGEIPSGTLFLPAGGRP